MATAQSPGGRAWLPHWWGTAVLISLGGAIFTFVVLWFAQLFAGSARLITSTWAGMVSVGIAALVLAGLSWWLLNASGMRRGLGWQCAMVWLVAYALLWLVGLIVRGVSLPLYLLFWLGVGVLAAWLLEGGQSARTPARAQHRTHTRPTQSVARTSQFGRIPSDTVLLLTQLVRQTRGNIVVALPDGTPPQVWEWTTRVVLDVLMRDWWENGSDEGLSLRDVEDLRSMIVLAASLANDGSGTYPLTRPVNQAVFRATLRANLEDWLANWNSDGVDGPPRR